MKKKLSLLMVALVAITAFAVQVAKRVAVDVADVAALTALANEAEFTFKGQVSVVAKIAKGDNTYCYVKDATGSTLIYANKANSEKVAALEVGKTIAADWTGTVSIYNKLFEAIPTSTLAVTEDAAVAPTFPEVAITDITEANVNKIVKLTDVTVFGISGNNFKIQKGELTVAGYDQFTVKGADFANGMVCSEMIGAIGRYNDAIQFQPISYTVGTPAPDPAALVVSPETGADITAALSDATAAATAPVKNITINLAKNGAYTIGGAIKTPVDLAINGNGATIDASTADVNFIELQSSSVKAMKADGVTESDHFLLNSVVVKDVTVSGLKKAIIRDTQKSLLKVLTIENSIIEASNAKPAIDFDGKGYVEQLNVKNSTIWAAASTAKNFTKYGSRPKNLWTKDGDTDVPGPYTLQGIDVQNSTFVNIASTNQHFCNNSQKGTAENVYTIKNNIFVDCGKIPNQVIVGFNGGQASATPAWDVDGNVFNATIDGVMSDASAQEVSKAGKHKVGEEDVDIVQNSIAAVVAFKDAANGDFTQSTAKAGDPRWIVKVTKDVTIAPESGDIAAALTAAKEELAYNEVLGNITINLTAGAAYTVSAPIVAPASLTINGNSATIDASGLEAALITTPAGDLTLWKEVSLTIKDVTIKGVKKGVFASAGKNYLYNDFLIDNSVIEIAATGGLEFDFRKGGVAKNFTINKSTIYAPTATENSLYTSQSAQKGTEAPGVTVQTFTITNSTLYNIAKGKNFFSHRQSNQKWMSYTVQNNLFVNCGKSGQVIKGMNGGQGGANPTWTIKGNAFNFEGADTSANEETGDAEEPVQDNVAGVMTFTNVETPDFGGTFEMPFGATAPEALGDNRWTITFTNAATGIQTVKAEDLENAAIYTIAGQRVEKAQKGLYIINGKKVVIK